MSAQQPLHSLLPTTNPVPPRLLSLSASLLAQSRSRVPNLKPDEEIARSYACAEIACNRLRAPLRLPPHTGRPPCKPSVYKKLLVFLERVLSEGHTPTTTPTKEKRGADGQPKPVVTPTAAKTPGSTGKKSGFAGTIEESVTDVTSGEAPAYVMPAIRKLCKAFSTPLLPPHAYTGTCVVLKLSGLWPPARGSKGKARDELTFRNPVLMVTIGVYFMVWARMQRGNLTPEIFANRLMRALEVAELETPPEDIEEWIKKMNKEGWCKGQDWWDSVPENVMQADREDEDSQQSAADDHEDEIGTGRSRRRKIHMDEEMEDDPDGVLLPGLGTMMQDAVDWLSEDKKIQFLDWKDGIMKRIKALDKGSTRLVPVRS